MATDALRSDVRPLSTRLPRESSASVLQQVEAVLRPLASLKLTVALFAAAIFLVFVGTLAQTSADVWTVVSGYFRSWYYMGAAGSLLSEVVFSRHWSSAGWVLLSRRLYDRHLDGGQSVGRAWCAIQDSSHGHAALERVGGDCCRCGTYVGRDRDAARQR